MSGHSESSPGPDLGDSDALVVLGLERLEDGGEEGLGEFLSQLGERGAAVRLRIEALGRMGILHPPAQDRLRLPERLGGYRLGVRLGMGGMGMVFEAVEEASGEPCAIKLIRPEFRIFESSRLRFQREIEAASRLSHPGIVQVRDFGEHEGILFYVMERLIGVNLGDLGAHRRGRPLESLTGQDLYAGLCELTGVHGAGSEPGRERFQGSWPDACVRIALEAAEALQHAHEQGVLHRDVKPSNLLLTVDGRVVLVDFGLAALEGEGSLTRSGSRLGSLPYMSPESLQGKGAVAGPYTDIYGLGVTLYELLALARAFPADTPLGLEKQIQAARPRALARANRAVPRDTETMVRKAMERDPGQRYLQAADFARDARAILRGRPILARRPGIVTRLLRLVQENPRPAALLGGLLALALGAALLFAGMQRKERRKTSIANERLLGEQQRVERNLSAAMESVAAQVRLIRDPKLYRAEFQGLRESLASSITEFLDQLLVVEGQSPKYRQARASAQFFIGSMELELGRTLSAHRRFEDCLALRELELEVALSTEDAAAHRLAYGNVAWTCQRLGVSAAYLGLHRVAAQACDRLGEALARLDPEKPMPGGSKLMYGHLAWTRGLLALDRGEWEAARVALESTRVWEERWLVELPRKNATRVGMANTDLYFVELELAQAKPKRALALAEQGLARIAEALVQEPDMPAARIEGARLATARGELLTALGRPSEALLALDQAMHWAEDWRVYTGDVPRILPELARCRIARAEALAARGVGAEARRLATAAAADLQGLLKAELRHGRELGELLSVLHRALPFLGVEGRGVLAQEARRHLAQACALAPSSRLLREQRRLWGSR